MQIYCLDEELSEWEFERNINQDSFVWFVYYYSCDGYDGSGEAVALGKDNLLYFYNLGHCSCYGPLDNAFSTMTIEDFHAKKESVLDEIHIKEVREKVEELLA